MNKFICLIALVISSLSVIAQQTLNVDQGYQLLANSDPTLNFNSGEVLAVWRDNDNTTYVGGTFTQYGSRVGTVVKFKPNGDVDTDFNPQVRKSVYAIYKNGTDLFLGCQDSLVSLNASTGAKAVLKSALITNGLVNRIYTIAKSGDNLLIGGDFGRITLPGNSRSDKQNFHRFNYGGTTFTHNNYANVPLFNKAVRVIKITSNGIFVGGEFTNVNINGTVDKVRHKICKLNGSFELDGWFDTGGVNVGVSSGYVSTIDVINNDNIIIGGKFTSATSNSSVTSISNLNNIAYLPANSNQSVTTQSFQNKLAAADEVYNILRINDTTVLVGLNSVNGYGNNAKSKKLAIIKVSGDLNSYLTNSSSAVLADNSVKAISSYNGTTKEIFIGGSFTSVMGASKNKFAKLFLDIPAPTANNAQTFCASMNPTLADITASSLGSVKYYDAASAGTELVGTTNLVNGTTYYLATLIGTQESSVRTAVAVNLVSEFNVTDTAVSCGEFTWSRNNTLYTTSTAVGSMPTYRFVNPNGCDTVFSLLLTIKPIQRVTVIDTTICGRSYTNTNGTFTYQFTGTATSDLTINDTLVGMNGCDSIVTYRLRFNMPTTTTATITSCNNYTWAVNSRIYTVSGNYVDTLVSSIGCDSIYRTLALTINSNDTTRFTEVACGSYTWTVNNVSRTYTTTSRDTIVLQNAFGCDSLVTLFVTINNPTSSTVVETACNSFTFTANNETYTTSGIRTIVIPNRAGCDSTITLDLTINESPTRTITEVACDTYIWSFNNQTYTTSGLYEATVANQVGCDSIIKLDLTINASPTLTENVTECVSYTWPLNGITYTATTQATHVLTATTGCDTIVTLNLTINALPVNTVSKVGATLTATATGATYQWFNCTSNTAITGATERVYEATENDEYYVEITKNGCSAVSACVEVTGLSVENSELPTMVVYPNPTAGTVNVSFTRAYDFVQIEVIDLTGKVIDVITVQNQDKVELHLKGEAGMYHLKVTTENGSSVRKITLM